MKLCIFPNDSLKSYFDKGELKEAYFNPGNYFQEIHIISLFDKEIEEEEKIHKLAGKAVLKIHKIGKVNLLNYKSFEKKIVSIISDINPELIRAFNPRVQGWLATKAAKKLDIPIIISLHTNYDEQREFSKRRNFFRYLKLKYASIKLEKFSLKNADSVICVYNFIVPYAKKMGAKDIHIIYNKVNTQKFSELAEKRFSSTKPTILSVGRLIDQKNHQYLIKSMKNLDARLLIIGDGPNFESLRKLINKLNLTKKIELIKRVPNEELPQYYVSCDVYAQPMENLGGIPIPVLEAMACGLPIVMSEHSSDYSEIIDEAVLFVKNNPNSFSKAFNQILTNSEYKEKLKRKSLNLINKITGAKMEEKELALYKTLMEKNSRT